MASYNIIEMMNGNIKVESELKDKGTKFSIYIPETIFPKREQARLKRRGFR